MPRIPMPRVLAIETSCDETSVAVLSGSAETPVLEAHITLSHAHKTNAYGGIVPEIVAREHLQYLEPTIQQALDKALDKITLDDIDLIAATCGPGLMGGLVIGATTAKTIALAKNIPFLAVNHLEGHALSPRLSALTEKNPAAAAAPLAAPLAVPAFPYLLLLVSGGHCQLLVVQALGDYRLLGQTRDDSTGECLDKGARLLQLPEASGAAVEKAAQNGNAQRFAQEITPLPQPMKKAENYDFSFSGLKSALARAVADRTLSAQQRLDGAAALQQAVFAQLTERCDKALQNLLETDLQETKTKPPKTKPPETKLAAFAVAGGVAANRTLYAQLCRTAQRYSLPFFCPRQELCTDNAAMIAYVALAHSETKTKTMSSSLACSLACPVLPRWSLQAGDAEKKTEKKTYVRSSSSARKAYEKRTKKTYSTQAKELQKSLPQESQS